MGTPYEDWKRNNPDQARELVGHSLGMQWFEEFGEYPRLMYRPDTPKFNEAGIQTNLFHEVTCEVREAGNEGEALTLIGEGWAFSPAETVQDKAKKVA